MASSTKIFLVFVLMNILFSVGVSMERSHTAHMEEQQAEVNAMRQGLYMFSQADPNTDEETASSSLDYELSSGNTNLWSTGIRGVIDAINPLSTFSMFEEYKHGSIEYAFHWIVSILRILVMFLMGIELYAFFKNKKTQT